MPPPPSPYATWQVLARLKESAAGQPGKVLTPSKGQMSVAVVPRTIAEGGSGGGGGAMAVYTDAAEAVLKRLIAAQPGGGGVGRR